MVIPHEVVKAEARIKVLAKERKSIAIRIVALTIAELNKEIPWSVIEGLKIGITRNRGHAHHKQNRMTIPVWVLGRSIHYIRYYVCHEIAHLIAFRQGYENEGHGVNFKNIERLFCASFDIRLAFKRLHSSYPVAICGPDGHFEEG